MDDAAFKQRVKRLQEISKVIEKLDPAIRNDAFGLLKDYVTAKPTTPAHGGSSGGSASSDGDANTFFIKHDHEKPSENVMLIVAWFYSQYGVFPISAKKVEDQAAKVGLTVPARSDNTMRNATREGKKLFKKATGGLELTVHGERFVKQTYSVTKGTKARPSEDEE